MSRLFTPPTWDRIVQMEGYLVLNVCPTCYAVFRIGGVWSTMQTPGMGNPDVYTVDIDPVQGRLWFTTPTVVTDAIAADITANFHPTLPAGVHPYTLV